MATVAAATTTTSAMPINKPQQSQIQLQQQQQLQPPQWNTQQLTVVCVIDTQLGDHLKDRECALEEIQQAVLSVGANFQRVQVNYH